ncbi:hypothetical protein GCM10025778_10570 [Paeniglutamicibacter antarcticus]|uniref:Uncharacterized protein n=1 Tax=Paeniglutamicibacter antarcticus TaxID=494023 RepID=A0ABP9TN56_9MICC
MVNGDVVVEVCGANGEGPGAEVPLGVGGALVGRSVTVAADVVAAAPVPHPAVVTGAWAGPPTQPPSVNAKPNAASAKSERDGAGLPNMLSRFPP